jgi:hypothetical protein
MAPAIEHVFQTNQAPLTVRNSGCYFLWRHVRLLWIELGHSLRSSLVKQQFHQCWNTPFEGGMYLAIVFCARDRKVGLPAIEV